MTVAPPPRGKGIRRPAWALTAGLLLTGTLGSVHAFSVFIVPLEAAHGAARVEVGLVYSLALVCLTLAVLGAHRVLGRLPPFATVLGVGLVAALGLGVAAASDTLAAFALGYGVLFGLANGLGYAFALLFAAHAYPARKGAVMGAVTAVYALGAMGFAKVFDLLIALQGVPLALSVMALVMLGVGAAGAVSACLSAVEFAPGAEESTEASGRRNGRGVVILLWLGYGFGCLAGLMAIGHAAGIAAAAGGTAGQLALGAMLIALGSALGGFGAGALADRWPPRRLLVMLPLLSGAALLGLAASDGPGGTLAGLTVVGLAYGAIIALYPVAAVRYFGLAEGPRAYGRVFTAWGTAGLVGPWMAGAIYDTGAGYGPALLMAAAAALASAAAAALPPKRERAV